jgi:hypothetical protein
MLCTRIFLVLLNFCCVVTDPEIDLCAASGHTSTAYRYTAMRNKIYKALTQDLIANFAICSAVILFG